MIFKKLSIALLCFLVIVGCVTMAEASTKARTATIGKGIAYVSGFADLSTGNTAEIDAQGSLQTSDLTSCTGSGVTHADSLVLTGAGTLNNVTFTSDAANDWLCIYDNTSATGTPKVDLILGTANETIVAKLDLNIATGIYCATATAMQGSVTYSVRYTADQF